MPSWQNNLLCLFFRSIGSVSYQSSTYNVEADRQMLDRLGKFVKPLSQIQCTPTLANTVPAEWITPGTIESQRVILYLHGGAFNSGSIVSHRSLVGNIATTCKARGLIIDYRLAPEYPYPCAIEDCRTAYEWLLASGIPAEQITVMGDSAGGTLTLTLLLQLRNEGRSLPAMAVCLSPATDLTMSGRTLVTNLDKDIMLNPNYIRNCIELYLRDADPSSPLISPLFNDLHGLPPILIQVGSFEVLLSDVVRFAEKAKQAGVPLSLEIWDGMQHVWQFVAPFLPEGRQAIQKIGEFVEGVYSRAPGDRIHPYVAFNSQN